MRLALGSCGVAVSTCSCCSEQGLILASWLRRPQLGAVLVHLSVGRKRGTPTPFSSCQPLFLSFRLSPAALHLPRPEEPAFSFVLDSAPQLAACPLTNGSPAPTSHHLPPRSGEKGPGQASPGSRKKERQKQRRGAESSPRVPAGKGKDGASSPPRKKKHLAQGGSVSPGGKAVADKGPSGDQEAPGCGDTESRPRPQGSDPGVCLDAGPISHHKKKKRRRRRMKEVEERCSGMLSSGR